MRARTLTCKPLVTIVLGLSLCSQQTHAADSDLPEQFNSIKEFLIDTVSESQSLGAATTQALLQENLLAFRTLQLRVDQARHVDDIIEELSTELDAIASNFERAASMRRDYQLHTDKSTGQLKAKRHQTRDAIAGIEKHIADKNAEIAAAKLALSSTSGSQRDRHQVTISANESVLHSLQTQIEIWQQFERAQQRLVSMLNISTERVDFVLFVLQKNAQVYREAANTVQLRRNARLALTDLQALGGIDSSLRDLTDSWREVDQIVREIGRQEFHSNAAS